MPELPEVQTIVDDLNKTVKGLKITGFWNDWKKLIKEPKVEEFGKQIKGKKILGARRRAKYILIDLIGQGEGSPRKSLRSTGGIASGKTLIIHQKISGHMLYGKWEMRNGKWEATEKGPLKNDPQNRFIRFILFLNNGKMLALSDLRRFAKVLLVDTDKINELKDIKELGPEPLDKSFAFEEFKEILKKKRGKIKTVLMDQTVIAGIGNIYSDEILWYAGIHPLKRVEKLSENELKEIYKAIKKILPIAINAKGDSMQDYRRLNGELGNYQYLQKTYQQTGKKCKKRDGGIIQRIKITGRSAHFCPKHQKL